MTHTRLQNTPGVMNNVEFTERHTRGFLHLLQDKYFCRSGSYLLHCRSFGKTDHEYVELLASAAVPSTELLREYFLIHWLKHQD